MRMPNLSLLSRVCISPNPPLIPSAFWPASAAATTPARPLIFSRPPAAPPVAVAFMESFCVCVWTREESAK